MSLLTEEAISHKSRKMTWNYVLEVSFKKLKSMVSADTLLKYPDWKITLTVHNNDYDKQLSAVIIYNNKHIAFFSSILGKPHSN